MAYRCGQDRKQMLLFPQSIDQYVGEDHPVRAYDAFVDALSFNELGIDLDTCKVGNSQYHPRLMLKLLLFGYSYGVKTSRKLERETYNNIAFIWLMKSLKPDHKTIAEFRRKNKKALRKALKLCARLCLKLDLIEGNILFVDGTKIRANAGKKQQHKKNWYQKQLKHIDQRINQLLAECEQLDEKEADQGSWAKMPKELGQQQRLKQSIVNALGELAKRSSHTKNGKERDINRVDPQSTVMQSSQGKHPGYNMQSVVDNKNGLIVSVDAVSDANDQNQFAPQIKAAEQTLDKKCKIACADAGYSNVEHLIKVESEQTKVILPSQKQASGDPPQMFDKNQFVYDQQTDCYRCPQAQRLIFRRFQNTQRTKRTYRIERPAICRACQHFGSCTKSNQGRSVVRHVNEEVKEHIEQRFDKAEYRQIYENRKERVEHPFGYIKKAIGFTQFGLKGLDGARAEAAIVATCFNLTRMITLLGGVRSLKARLQAV
jgi:transposase